MSPTMQKVFLYVIPPLSGLIMIGWPAALQLTFFTTAMISFSQSWFLRQAWFRALIGIQPLPQHHNVINVKKNEPSPYTGTMTRYQPPGHAVEKKKHVLEQKEHASEQKRRGGVSGIKSALSHWWKESKKKAQEWQQQPPQNIGRRTPAEIKHAKAYHERRERELAQEREMKRLEQEEQEHERKRRRS